MSKTKLSLRALKNLQFLAFRYGSLKIEKIIEEAKIRGWTEVVNFMENHLDQYYKMI